MKKEVLLSLNDRINLLSFLPSEGNFVLLKQSQDLRDALIFSQEEVDKYEIKFVDNGSRVSWNGNVETAFEIPDMLYENIVKRFEDMEKKGKLTTVLFNLYKIFCIKDESEK